jgi:putative ABC transport system ATP-binding protein
MSSPLLSLQQVSLTLESASGPVEILRDISLDIDRSESIVLVGPSGSGKTSTLLLMAGLERATAGKILLEGQDMTRLSEDELAALRRAYCGIVFQSFHLIPTLTAQENVAIPLELAGCKDAFEQADAMLKQVGLAHRGGHYPSQLSGGEQQRVAIARAFAPRPPIILADEPTGNLDRKNGEHVMELLLELKRDYGATLVLITHDAELAKRCDRQVEVEAGKLREVAHGD